jgi:hypothetical protein
MNFQNIIGRKPIASSELLRSRMAKYLSCTAAGVLLSFAMAGPGYAQVQSPAPVAAGAMSTLPVSELMATKGAGNTDPSGATGPLSPQGKALFKAPTVMKSVLSTMYACLEMDYDNGPNAMWVIDAKGTYNGSLFTIDTAGTTVHGAICDSPNWKLTGTIGVQESIVGTNTLPPNVDPACNRKITIRGSLQGFIFWQGPVPPTQIGANSGYNFPSMGPNQWFPQTTHLRSFAPTHQICQ